MDCQLDRSALQLHEASHATSCCPLNPYHLTSPLQRTMTPRFFKSALTAVQPLRVELSDGDSSDGDAPAPAEARWAVQMDTDMAPEPSRKRRHLDCYFKEALPVSPAAFRPALSNGSFREAGFRAVRRKKDSGKSPVIRGERSEQPRKLRVLCQGTSSFPP